MSLTNLIIKKEKKERTKERKETILYIYIYILILYIVLYIKVFRVLQRLFNVKGFKARIIFMIRAL